MKRLVIFLTFLLLGMPLKALACEVCENRQPDILKGVTHGIGPQGSIDYIITWGAVVIVGVTLFFSIKFLVKPNESKPDHIKNIVVD